MQAALISALLLAVSAAPALAQYDECRHEAQRNTTIPVQDAKRLVVEAGSGMLKIVGKPGISHIRVSGRACASSAALLEEITLRTNRNGGDVIVEANIRNRLITGDLDMHLTKPRSVGVS